MNSYLSTVAGLALLLGLVSFQYYKRHKHQKNIERLWREAQAALTEQRIADAERLLRECVKEMPLFIMARRALGAVLAQENRFDEAEKELKLAAELQPRKPEGHLDLALFYARFQPERIDDAVNALKEVITHAPQLRQDIYRDARFAAFKDHPGFAAFGPESA